MLYLVGFVVAVVIVVDMATSVVIRLACALDRRPCIFYVSVGVVVDEAGGNSNSGGTQFATGISEGTSM